MKIRQSSSFHFLQKRFCEKKNEIFENEFLGALHRASGLKLYFRYNIGSDDIE